MIEFLRRTAYLALWLFAGFGALCASMWSATALGLVKPLVVISGSMEPEIMTGDLLIDVRVPIHDLEVGDIVSVPSPLTGDLVTHRIEQIEPGVAGQRLLSLKGDNNEFSDAVEYPVTGEVWQPGLHIAGAGGAAMRLASPGVAIPLLCGLTALVAIALMFPRTTPARPRGRETRAAR